MLWIYNIGIAAYSLLLRMASIFNSKAKLFIEGRRHIFRSIAQKTNPNDHPVWFHFASLGEFEQGRPVLEKLKQDQPDQAIVVTFFSPSGYEIRKNYELANVFYLPLDTAANARQFIELVRPKLAIFTKYEFWYHYFKILNDRQIPLYLISGIFRPDQAFFKWYGGFYRRILTYVSYFFVQNEESEYLLKSIGIKNVVIGGDTRFDRVYENALQPKILPPVEIFCAGRPVFIAGSTWPADEKLIATLVKEHPDWKFLIAPHEIDKDHLDEIEKLFPDSARYSAFSTTAEIGENSLTTNQVLVIDNIGMLSSLYQYAKIAFIGGGFGAGIHNTLEAAAFGLPVIFGPKYEKFQEAKDLIGLGAAKSVADADELEGAFEFFKANNNASIAARNYVSKKKGATDLILKAIRQ